MFSMLKTLGKNEFAPHFCTNKLC